MKRNPLYSASVARRAPRAEPPPSVPPVVQTPPPTRPASKPARRKALERALLVCAGGALAFLAVLGWHPAAREAMSEEQVQALVERHLGRRPPNAVLAYEAVRPSVVMVRGLGADAYEESHLQKAVGSGVVIVDSGIILTNLHVAIAGERLQVVFADGTESDAEVVAVRPGQDLAVLRAKTLPDDLQAATLGSAQALQQGDEVIAVGFPFGIGPSVSAGVVSGLQREYRSPEGQRVLTDLIQFDAAANPGNSGGPLVTAKGEVVGIVTGILNPTEQRVFIGIGFAVPIEAAAAAVGQPPF